MKKTMISILGVSLLLTGCASTTLDKLNADVQEAATVSCLLSDGVQIAYTVGTQVASAADLKDQKVLQASTSIANGSAALCNALTTVNTQISKTPSLPTASATLVTTPSTSVIST